MQSPDCHANEPGFPNPDFPTFFFFFFFFFFFSFFLLLNKFSAAAIFNIAEMYNKFPPSPPRQKNWSQKWSLWRKCWTTYSSTPGGGICECSRCQRRRLQVCAIFSEKVGIPFTASDIEVAHRTGQRSSTRARPILVRFFDRKKRDSVIISRRNLKNKGYVIEEDLTYANYQVFRKASEHSATMSVWSSNGQILAKVKNGRIVRVNIHTDLDEAFRRAMSGNEMSADEEE